MPKRAPEFDIVEKNLASARTILLTINIVCAFLFVLVFEIIFGWQSFRPGASRVIFSENLARIACEKDSSDFQILDRTVVTLARTTLCELGVSEAERSTLEQTRSAINSRIMLRPIWEQEEILRLFVARVTRLRQLLGTQEEKLAGQPLTTITKSTKNEKKANGDVSSQETKVEQPVLPDNRALLDIANAATFGSPQIAFYVQEILDRWNVNEETRGRRVGRRQYDFPILGTSMQIEDVTLPVAAFLILLTYWLMTSLLRAYESSSEFLNGGGSAPHNADDLDQKGRAHLLLQVLQFVRFDAPTAVVKDSKSIGNPRLINVKFGIIWLFFGPFLVVSSSIIANMHEFFVLDFRYHASAFVIGSPIARAYVVFTIFMITAAFVLLGLAITMASGFIKLVDNTVHCVKDLQLSEKCLSLELQEQMVIACIVATPFVLFGGYSALQSTSARFTLDYFPNSATAGVYIAMTLIHFGLTALSLLASGKQYAKVMFWVVPAYLAALGAGGLLTMLNSLPAYDDLKSITYVGKCFPWPMFPGVISACALLIIAGTCLWQSARAHRK